MKHYIKAQTDDMKSKLKLNQNRPAEYRLHLCRKLEKSRGRSSKQKVYSFKNTENPIQKNTEDLRNTARRKSSDFVLPYKTERLPKIKEISIVRYYNSTSFANVKPVLDSIFATFGKLHTVKIDNEPPFHGHQFREYAEKKEFYHHRITPRHPRANGEYERFMENLNEAIRIAKKENTDYKEKIDGMLEAYTPHSSKSKSPFELLFGRRMNKSCLACSIFVCVSRQNCAISSVN
ncbi:uncharacterized protein K02A2.6-like [Paramuricea clavata]|uniref:Uncharacterized protein K02A2.6-like n=1 Tax=Paramuricea clavata TaxID=317549 RepID=A0A6S7FJF1_PARCT|nr:uncharacterized protein K02A2.6-like [Paramuricea clavata]